MRVVGRVTVKGVPFFHPQNWHECERLTQLIQSACKKMRRQQGVRD